MHYVPRNFQGLFGGLAGAAAGWLLLQPLTSSQLAGYGAACLTGFAAICLALVVVDDWLYRRS